MAKLIDIEGIGETYAKRLHKAGVTSTSNLLEKGASSAGRKDIAEKSGIGEHLSGLIALIFTGLMVLVQNIQIC